MVHHLMARITHHEEREVFSGNVFRRHLTRPWGRRRAPVSRQFTPVSRDLRLAQDTGRLPPAI